MQDYHTLALSRAIEDTILFRLPSIDVPLHCIANIFIANPFTNEELRKHGSPSHRIHFVLVCSNSLP